MKLVIFNNLSEEEKSKTVENLINESTPRQDFFVLVILSFLMATFGILMNNDAIIIGSMLIAPMLYPILSLSLGVVMSDSKLMSRSMVTILKSVGIGMLASFLVAIFALVQKDYYNLEKLYAIQPSLGYVAIALVSGFAAAFALSKPKLDSSLPGVAISVSLIPPLSAAAIGIALFDFNVFRNAILVFLINVIGICFIGVVVFSLFNFYIKKQLVEVVVEKAEADLKKEEASEKGNVEGENLEQERVY